jgi:hypothetical protein
LLPTNSFRYLGIYLSKMPKDKKNQKRNIDGNLLDDYFGYLYSEPDLNLDDGELDSSILDAESGPFDEPKKIYLINSEQNPQFFTAEYLNGNVTNTWTGLAESIFG